MELIAVQLLRAGVAPFSNPPFPVELIKVVCEKEVNEVNSASIATIGIIIQRLKPMKVLLIVLFWQLAFVAAVEVLVETFIIHFVLKSKFLIF